MASSIKSLVQSLGKYVKKPWEITWPCSHPEYRSALPMATEFRPFAPASPPQMVCVPTSDPETVFDIKYYTRDSRRDRPPVRRIIVRKADVEQMMAAKTYGPDDFSKVYLVDRVQEEQGVRDSGYQK